MKSLLSLIRFYLFIFVFISISIRWIQKDTFGIYIKEWSAYFSF